MDRPSQPPNDGHPTAASGLHPTAAAASGLHPTAGAAHATACGKVILLGEHAVVYGVPALAAGIDRGARAEATLGPESAPSTLSLGGQTIVANTDSPQDLERAFAALLGDGCPPITASAQSDLPPGGGLGSSAAIGVALARCVEELTAHGDAGRRARVFDRALAWERIFHGNPSGIDTHAAANGGIFRFVRGEPAIPVHLADDLWLCVGLSGSGASTRSMVEGLARLFDRKPDLKARTIDAIRALVSNAALAIEAGDIEGLGKLMDLNHMVLAGLFLSTEALERLCHLARTSGALGAKLTGSGGGGSVIALVPPPEAGEKGPGAVATSVLAAWRQAGFDGFVTRIAAPRDARD